MKIEIADRYIIRLEKGDEIISSLIDFCLENRISFATFNAIGAVSRIKLALYKLDKKEYLHKSFDGPFEIASMYGNICEMDGNFIVHSHGVFSDINFDGKAGHVGSAIISATGEIALQSYKNVIFRKKNDEIGLNLLDI